MLTAFDYHQPATLEEAIALLVRYGKQARILAGGTALLVDMQHGECEPAHLIGLENVPGLNSISENGELRIGALATLTELAEFVDARLDLRAFVESIWLFGGKQIQNVATLGGNICKASPGADMAPPLLCLDAQLRLHSPDGERVVPLDGFLTGPDQTAIRPAEILTEIVLPPVPPRTGTAFQKMMRRRAEDISIAAACARITLTDDSQCCAGVRIALCAVAPTPIRVRAAEAALSGFPLTSERVKTAARAASEEARPIDDVRASAEYRRMVLETLVERAVTQAAERALGGASGKFS